MKKVLAYLKGLLGERILAIVFAQVLTVENIVAAVNALIEMGEELAAKTETKIDDNAFAVLRKALGVEKPDA
jgi:hypothetical protein